MPLLNPFPTIDTLAKEIVQSVNWEALSDPKNVNSQDKSFARNDVKGRPYIATGVNTHTIRMNGRRFKVDINVLSYPDTQKSDKANLNLTQKEIKALNRGDVAAIPAEKLSHFTQTFATAIKKAAENAGEGGEPAGVEGE